MNSIHDYEHPYVCTDAVVFSMKTKAADSYRKLPTTKLNVLLYQRLEEPFQSKWCLPGGFLDIDELPEDNIKHKLWTKAQLEHCYLEQLYSFCAIDRDPRGRVISISYLGLMQEVASEKINDQQWFEIIFDQNSLILQNQQCTLTEKDLGFDHYRIIQLALERLQSKIQYCDLALHLLPDTFTLTEMQNVYETILSKKETMANFRRKVADLVQETDLFTADKGHRPAKLFTKIKR